MSDKLHSVFTRACWWASGVDQSLITDDCCPASEQARFAVFGMFISLASVVALVAGYVAAGEVLFFGDRDLVHPIKKIMVLFACGLFSALLVLNLLRLLVGMAGRRTDRIKLYSLDALRGIGMVIITFILAISAAAPIQISVVARDVRAQSLVSEQASIIEKARSTDAQQFGDKAPIAARARIDNQMVRQPSTGFFGKVEYAYLTNKNLCWTIVVAIWLLFALPPTIRLLADRGAYDFLVIHRNRALLAKSGIEPEAFTLYSPNGGLRRIDAFHSARRVFTERLQSLMAERRQDFAEIQEQSLKAPFGVHPTPNKIARKKPVPVTVEFAAHRQTIETREGPVIADPGDAVVTSVTGERWPVARTIFAERYMPVEPTIFGMSGVYRARPQLPVRVVQLTYPIRVLVSGGRSDLTGQAGDWLIDYGNATLGVVAGDVFAATYELMDVDNLA